MKKTIKILVEKMEKIQEKKDGTLQGGFGSIKGGFNSTSLYYNFEYCSNYLNCVYTTNLRACTNSGTCFA